MDQVPAYTGYKFTETLHSTLYPAIDAASADLAQPSKVVFITGSGRGIGRSIALEFAKAGVAGICLQARTLSQLEEVESSIKAINGNIRVMKFPFDVTDEAKFVQAAQAVEVEFGRLDVLINNAGTSDIWAPLTEGVAKDYWNTWEVNTKGPYLSTKAFLPLLVQTAESHKIVADIVNISSIGAHMVFPGASGYQTTKLAVTRFSEFVQAEYGAKGINCTAVNPGGVLTTLAEQLPLPIHASKSLAL